MERPYWWKNGRMPNTTSSIADDFADGQLVEASDKVVMAEHHAFGQTTRAARIEQRDQVLLGIDGDIGYARVLTFEQGCKRA